MIALLIVVLALGVWLGLLLADADEVMRRDVDEIDERRRFEQAMRDGTWR